MKCDCHYCKRRRLKRTFNAWVYDTGIVPLAIITLLLAMLLGQVLSPALSFPIAVVGVYFLAKRIIPRHRSLKDRFDEEECEGGNKDVWL